MTVPSATMPCPLAATLATAFAAGNVDTAKLPGLLNGYQPEGPEYSPPEVMRQFGLPPELFRAAEFTLIAEHNIRGAHASPLGAEQISNPCTLFARAAYFVWDGREANGQGDPVAWAVRAFLMERAGEYGNSPMESAGLFMQSAVMYMNAGTIGGSDLSAAAKRVNAKAAETFEKSGSCELAGDCYMRIGQTQKALEMFQKFSGSHEWKMRIAKKAISAYVELEMYDEAISVHKSLEQFDEAVKVADEGAKYHAWNGEYEKAGALLIEGGKIASELNDDPLGAIKMFARALEMHRLAELTGMASAENGERKKSAASFLAIRFLEKDLVAAALEIDEIETGGELLSMQRELLEKRAAAEAEAAKGYEMAADVFRARELPGLEAKPRYQQAMALLSAGRYTNASKTFGMIPGARDPEVIHRRGHAPLTMRSPYPQAEDAKAWRDAAFLIAAYLKTLAAIRNIESGASGAELPKTPTEIIAEYVLSFLNEDAEALGFHPDFSIPLPYLLIRRNERLLKAWEAIPKNDDLETQKARELLVSGFQFAKSLCEKHGLLELVDRVRGDLKRLGVEEEA